MDKLAKVLPACPSALVVRGHTDGRPYSTAPTTTGACRRRARTWPTYMLVRGGIDEKRFERIEGHADRNLRVPNDPEAAQNRRIEILLRKATP